MVVFVTITAGCSSSQYLKLRKEPYNPLAGPLQLVSRSGAQPSDRTERVLRRYDLADDYKKSPDEALSRLQDLIESEPTDDKIHAFAELAYVRGKQLESQHKEGAALDWYGASVAYAYRFLFDPRFDEIRNPYDPHFRSACDLYNESLEAAMRIVKQRDQLLPGSTHRIATAKQEFLIDIVIRGRWAGEDIERLEFVSDYDLEGLTNRHHTYGLGVPMIAVRHQRDAAGDSVEQFYPPGLSFPMTAFLRVLPRPPGDSSTRGVHTCVLELHDPLSDRNIQVANRWVPLETDLTTPLAYFLDNPKFEDRKNIATVALLDANAADSIKGLFMLEPYDPNKIPVVMVHGLWSSPVTWMEMFNDLRSFPEIRERYQFWFYLYPTGQPFWVSATQMRADLAHVRQVVDPQRLSPALDQMTLVGHSMGGLVAQLQVINSGDDFWRVLSDKPFNELKASPEDREQLAAMLFFQPNPSVKRVITIGTPHRGSEFANDYTRWLSRAVIKLPSMVKSTSERLTRDNADLFRDTELLTISTSIDSLSPDSPLFPVMLRAQRASWVQQHNIVGVVPEQGIVGKLSGNGDGIVSYESAHLDSVASEITVPSDHLNVHRHPRATLEVRRALLEHLASLDGSTSSTILAQRDGTNASFANPWAAPNDMLLPPIAPMPTIGPNPPGLALPMRD